MQGVVFSLCVLTVYFYLKNYKLNNSNGNISFSKARQSGNVGV
jgi:hypothetical protein